MSQLIPKNGKLEIFDVKNYSRKILVEKYMENRIFFSWMASQLPYSHPDSSQRQHTVKHRKHYKAEARQKDLKPTERTSSKMDSLIWVKIPYNVIIFRADVTILLNLPQNATVLSVSLKNHFTMIWYSSEHPHIRIPEMHFNY